MTTITPRYNPATFSWYDATPHKRYVAYCVWENGETEEIDIDAPDKRTALGIAVWVVNNAYEPGGRINDLQEKQGLYV
jgi:hypothetical protein